MDFSSSSSSSSSNEETNKILERRDQNNRKRSQINSNYYNKINNKLPKKSTSIQPLNTSVSTQEIPQSSYDTGISKTSLLMIFSVNIKNKLLEF